MVAREVGLDVLDVACELVLDGTVVSASVVLNEMRRLVAPAPGSPRPRRVRFAGVFSAPGRPSW